MKLYVLKNPISGLYARRFGRGFVWVSRERANTFNVFQKGRYENRRVIGKVLSHYLKWEKADVCEPVEVQSEETPTLTSGVAVKATTFQVEIGMQKLYITPHQAEQLISQLTSLLNK